MPRPDGDVSPELRSAFDAGLFRLAPARPGNSLLAVAEAQTVWRIPVIMVSYLDDTLTYSGGAFDTALFDTTGATATGSVFDYYQWASAGRIHVTGEVVARVHLPHEKRYYGDFSYGLSYSGSPNNTFGAVYDAVFMASPNVDWSRYDQDHDGYVDMVWVLHPGMGGETSTDRNDLWSITSRLSGGWRSGTAFLTSQLVPGAGNLVYRIDRFSTVPELSWRHPGQRAEIGVFCHEFGHALGLPDLYDTSTMGGGGGSMGPGNWSLMATGGYGGDGISPEYPSHPGAWCSQFLGWLQPTRLTVDTTVTLTPMVSGGQVLEWWFQGESNAEHFLLENRTQQGFDRNIQYEGLLVTHVDEAAIGQRLAANRINAGSSPGMTVVEADGDDDMQQGRNRGDAYDPFPGLGANSTFDESSVPATRTFGGATTTLALRNITRVGPTVRFDMQVKAPGWWTARELSTDPFQPLESSSPALTGVRDDAGNCAVVVSEMHGGIPQIMVREFIAGQWRTPLQISHSTYAALDPCIARVGDQDLAVAWSDSRGGRARIYYRCRTAGVWGDETVVGTAPGENRTPSLGVDRAGRVHLAWLNTLDDVPTVHFTRFMYFAPFGQTTAITGTSELPGSPLVVTNRAGNTHVLWIDRASLPQRIWYRRSDPDSGMSPRLAFTPDPNANQTALTATVDSAGCLYAVWATSSVSGRDLHYQRRPTTGKPSPPDSTIESRTSYLQDLTLAVDRQGALHLAFDSSPLGTPQIYYKRWRAQLGWECVSTEITPASAGSASHPVLLVESPGNVRLLYTGYPALSARPYERVRQLDGPTLLGVPPAPAAGLPLALRTGPNPLRAGQVLRVQWAGAPANAPEAIELFDLGGRRVATSRLTPALGGLSAEFNGARTRELSSGVYFVRSSDQRATARVVVLR